MTPRPRKKLNSALPQNLYSVRSGAGIAYRYKHPITKKFHGMGTDKLKAIAAAKQLNGLLIPNLDIVNSVLNCVTVSEHVDWYFKEIVPGREYAPKTIEVYRTRCKQICAVIGSHPIDSITVKEISDLMAPFSAKSAQQIRHMASDLFKTAAGRGLIEINPAILTNSPIYKKSRKRLTMDQYTAIHALAEPWMQRAMELALVTLQRRSDVVKLRFDSIKDGYLYVIQEKTKKYDSGYLKIAVGPELERVVQSCRDDVPSPYLVHKRLNRRVRSESKDHWTQILPKRISVTFLQLRDQVEEIKAMPQEQRPTFHEIRSLGIKRYKDNGIEPQFLAGHANQQMTKNYDSGHSEIRWVETKTL